MHQFCKKPSVFCMFLVLFLTKEVYTKCSDNICENIHDLDQDIVDKKINFIYFEHWYPVKLQFLKEHTFDNFKNLEFISIKKLINGIHRNSLNNLTKLHTILLVENNIKEVPRNLFLNTSIEKVVIKKCHLKNLNNFNKYSTLTSLKIEENNIQNVKKSFPNNLKELVLKKNGITYIEKNSFENLKKLQILDLSNNYLTTFESEKYLSHTKKLKSLHLSFNNLQTISRLPILEKLKYLYFDNNTISTIANQAFQGCQRLEILNLSNNNIKNISKDYFENIYFYLNKFYISYNNITCINLNIFESFPNLKTVWLGKNYFNCNCYEKLKKYLFIHNINSLFNYDNENYCI